LTVVIECGVWNFSFITNMFVFIVHLLLLFTIIIEFRLSKYIEMLLTTTIIIFNIFISRKYILQIRYLKRECG
jgi:hypothetical protein